MPATEDELRRQIANERAELETSLVTLRAELDRAKQRAKVAAGGLVAVTVAWRVVRAVRKRR